MAKNRRIVVRGADTKIMRHFTAALRESDILKAEKWPAFQARFQELVMGDADALENPAPWARQMGQVLKSLKDPTRQSEEVKTDTVETCKTVSLTEDLQDELFRAVEKAKEESELRAAEQSKFQASLNAQIHAAIDLSEQPVQTPHTSQTTLDLLEKEVEAALDRWKVERKHPFYQKVEVQGRPYLLVGTGIVRKTDGSEYNINCTTGKHPKIKDAVDLVVQAPTSTSTRNMVKSDDVSNSTFFVYALHWKIGHVVRFWVNSRTPGVRGYDLENGGFRLIMRETDVEVNPTITKQRSTTQA